MSDYTIRPLCPEDLDRVSDIQSKVTGSKRRAFFERLLAQVQANPQGFLHCGVEENGTLQGFAFARIQEGDFGSLKKVAVLDIMGVAPESQGKGVGKTVIAGIEQQVKAKDIDNLKTQADWADRALTGFFSSVGFKLGSSQIIDRDTSLMREVVAEVAPIKMDSRWQVHSDAGGNDYDRLSRDQVLVRSFKKEDLAAIVRIDSKYTGLDRSSYFEAKSREMLDESGIRVSVVAEDNGIVTGFIMARVDFGEFGRLDTQAVIDTIGVHPAYKGSGIGHALLSQLLLNLSTLKVESVRTQVSWDNSDLQNFLRRCGFKPSQRLILTKIVS